MEIITFSPGSKTAKLGYLAFTLSGLALVLIGQEYGMGGACITLALIFNPFKREVFQRLATYQKVGITTQAIIGMLLIGFEVGKALKAFW
jgi:hypothetical protein